MDKPADTPPIPLFVTPTVFEAMPVRKALGHQLARNHVRLAVCGVGPERAGAFCQRINSTSISTLVLLGWAGGLIADLFVGDTVCADSAWAPDRNSLKLVPLAILGARNGLICTSPAALLTPESKLAAAQQSGGIAVDMEAFPLAEWAAEKAIPFYHLRVISDSFDESLPDFNHPPGQILRHIRRYPGLFMQVVKVVHRLKSLDPILSQLAEQALIRIEEERL